jgi:plastocyanin
VSSATAGVALAVEEEPVAHWIDVAPRTAGRRLARGTAGLCLTFLSLTACGGTASNSAGAASSSSVAGGTSSSAAAGAPSAASTVGQDGTLTATEADFSIDLGTKTLKAGPYLVKVDNTGNATHDLVVEQNGAKIAGTSSIAPGQSASLSVTLKPGSYVFYCSIGNHRSMGMETTVTVQ